MPDFNIPMPAAAQIPQQRLTPVDPGIPMSVQPFKPIDDTGNTMRAYDMMGKVQEFDAQQRVRTDEANDRAVMQAAMASGINPYTTDGMQELVTKFGPKLSQKGAAALLKNQEAVATTHLTMQKMTAMIDDRQLTKMHDVVSDESRDLVNVVKDPGKFEARKAAYIKMLEGDIDPVTGQPRTSAAFRTEMAGLDYESFNDKAMNSAGMVKSLSAASKRKLEEAQAFKDTKQGELAATGKMGVELANIDSRVESGIMTAAEGVAAKKAITEGGKGRTAAGSLDNYDPEEMKKAAHAAALYRQPPPTGFRATSPAGIKFLNMVREDNPDYDPALYAARSKVLQNYLSGPESKIVRSFGTANRHLDTLLELGSKLDNSGVPMWNTAANYLAKQTGSPEVVGFDAAKNLIAAEVLKGVIGAAGGVVDRKEESDKIKSSQNPAQLGAAVASYRKLIEGQLTGYKKTFIAGGGDAAQFEDIRAGEFIGDTAKKARAKVDLTPGQTDNAPGNVPVTPEVALMRAKSLGTLEKAKAERSQMSVAYKDAKTPDVKEVIRRDLELLNQGIMAWEGQTTPAVTAAASKPRSLEDILKQYPAGGK